MNDNITSLQGIFVEVAGRKVELPAMDVDAFVQVTDAIRELARLANQGDQGAKSYLNVLSEIDGRTDRLRILPFANGVVSDLRKTITPREFSIHLRNNLQIVDAFLIKKDERFFVNEENVTDVSVNLLKKIGTGNVLRTDAPVILRRELGLAG